MVPILHLVRWAIGQSDQRLACFFILPTLPIKSDRDSNTVIRLGRTIGIVVKVFVRIKTGRLFAAKLESPECWF